MAKHKRNVENQIDRSKTRPTLKEIRKLDNERANVLNRKCECGHTVTFTRPNEDKLVCHHCNKYVFRDKKAEFKCRTTEAVRRESRSYRIIPFEQLTFGIAIDLGDKYETEMDYKNEQLEARLS